jgi:hypothetical protein
MIRDRFGIGAALFVFALAASACGSPSPSGPSDLPINSSGLTQELRSHGLMVAEAGMQPLASFPFFSAPALRLTVNGNNHVHVFEYPTKALATTEAAKVAPAGTPVGSTQITWVSPPRFYTRDTIIVLYVGTDAAVIRALAAVLGPPFAGAH